MTALAQTPTVTLPYLEGVGPLGNLKNAFGGTDPEPSLYMFEKTLSVGIGVLTVSAGIWFIIQIFAGTFQWLASGGEKQALQNAQKRITNAVLGLFLVVFAYGLILLLGAIFGIAILSPALVIQTFFNP